MSDLSTEHPPQHESIARSAIAGGKAVVSAAAHGAREGAKIALGTFFAGCEAILNLGVKAARNLPLAGPDGAAREPETRSAGLPPLGWWTGDGLPPEASDEAIARAILNVREPIQIVELDRHPAVARAGRIVINAQPAAADGRGRGYPLRALVPPLHPEMLGDPAFRAAHGLRYAYVAGAMANGIAGEPLVEAMSRAGMLGFFGAAGLTPQRVEQAIDRLERNLGDRPYGFNLIHSPGEPALETAIADLYLRRGVRLVDASAYLDLTLPLIRYRVAGLRRDAAGRVVCINRVVAKVSRAEVARKFMAPPPTNLLTALVAAGRITHEQAAMAQTLPVATDITVEADSGGHTDNRPAIALLPGMIALRDEMQARYGYDEPLRVGAAGGISTPASAAAAFAMGAAYILTGSVNQGCVEASTSQAVREMLAHAGPADVAMAPAADMFEMGVKVQVLKWGTMFAVRARKLYDLYREYKSWEAVPAAQRTLIERDYLRTSFEEAWEETRAYFLPRDARQIERAEKDPRHKLALVFRSYLGRSSDWANRGEPTRKADYQVWCGPAMGAFNEWVCGSFLDKPENRSAVTVAMNILLGAAVLTRVNWLRAQGVEVPPSAGRFRPMELAEIEALLARAS